MARTASITSKDIQNTQIAHPFWRDYADGLTARKPYGLGRKGAEDYRKAIADLVNETIENDAAHELASLATAARTEATNTESEVLDRAWHAMGFALAITVQLTQQTV